MNDNEIYEKILSIVLENKSGTDGITRTELTRIYTEKFGTSPTIIWEYTKDLIESGRIALRKTKIKQHALFIPKLD